MSARECRTQYLALPMPAISLCPEHPLSEQILDWRSKCRRFDKWLLVSMWCTAEYSVVTIYLSPLVLSSKSRHNSNSQYQGRIALLWFLMARQMSVPRWNTSAPHVLLCTVHNSLNPEVVLKISAFHIKRTKGACYIYCGGLRSWWVWAQCSMFWFNCAVN
jgi:hypothetical protein